MRVSLFDRLSLAAYAAVPVLAASPVRLSGGPSFCLFHAATGLPCPGCGMGHALVAAWRGRWALSLAFHPLALPLLAVWTAWVLWGLANARRGRDFSSDFPRLEGARGLAALAIVLAVYALRLRQLVG